jgi:hypothetical protein
MTAMNKKQKKATKEINKLLDEVRKKIKKNWKDDRVLLRISDTQNPPRTRREDIEGDIQKLGIE